MRIIEAVQYPLLPLTSREVLHLENGAIVAIHSAVHDLGTFTTTAWSAPFIGLLGMCFGILYAFRGYIGARHEFIVRLTSDFATALVMTAMGLLVAVFAMWFRNWHRNRIEALQAEMSNAAIETIAYLNAHPLWRNQPEHSADRNNQHGACCGELY